MLYVVIGVMALGVCLVVFSPFVLSGDESRQEEQREPFARAVGWPCRICAVLESAHLGWITGHRWSI